MKYLYKTLANIVFLSHLVFGAFLLVAWQYPDIRIIYISSIVIWILCWLILGYCPITKWEFILRKKYTPQISTDYEFIQYYSHKFFGIKLKSRTIVIGGMVVAIILISLSLTM